MTFAWFETIDRIQDLLSIPLAIYMCYKLYRIRKDTETIVNDNSSRMKRKTNRIYIKKDIQERESGVRKICPNCNQLRFIQSKGLCGNCYNKQRKKIKCKRCYNKRFNAGNRLCMSCFNAKYRTKKEVKNGKRRNI